MRRGPWVEQRQAARPCWTTMAVALVLVSGVAAGCVADRPARPLWQSGTGPATAATTRPQPPASPGHTTASSTSPPSSLDRMAPGSQDLPRQPMTPTVVTDPSVQPAQYATSPGNTSLPGPSPPPPPGLAAPPTGPVSPWPAPGSDVLSPPGTPVPFDIQVTEARTGMFTIGAGINSDAGVTGQIILDERNFDITRFPRSWDDFVNGTAFRGAGQGFRLEAMPGNRVERYLVSFTEPYLFDTQVSMNTSGYLFQRGFFDWAEERLGGRLGFGYRLTPDLSLALAFRGENVKIFRPRVTGIPQLDAVLGDNDLFSGRVTLTHDTRDIPFAPTEGHYLELAYEQTFGSFDYPRGELDFRKYFLVRERPDGSGRHTLAYSFRLGVTGAQTPIFENYFAGGFSTLRGFDFRGASPQVNGVTVGGQFRFLGSVEYFFPLTADDMIKGVLFCDFGTVEEKVAIHAEDYRVAPGFGLRISIPALGPAPIALDFAVPVAREQTDEVQNFNFFFGFGRG